MLHIKLRLKNVMPHRRPAGGAEEAQQIPQQLPPAPITSCRGFWQSPLPLLAFLTTALATGFHRFLARFSGRRRTWPHLSFSSAPPWALFFIAVSTLLQLAETCSSRTTPKPRPPAPPTQRPNITFHTYICPPAYDTWYCLNGATCFTVKIGESLLYNCECADGYMGPRCEYKDLDGSYLPSQRRYMLETASIAGGATIAVFLVVVLCVVVYVHVKRKAKQARITSTDCVDGPVASLRRIPTFGTRSKLHQSQQERCSRGAGQEWSLALNGQDHGDGRSVLSTASKQQIQQITTLLPATGDGAGENLA